MKVLGHGQLLTLLTLVSCSLSAPTNLSGGASPNRDLNLVGRRGYTYDPPSDAAVDLPDHFELAGPPPAPLLPNRPTEKLSLFSPAKRTSSTTTTTTTTTTTPTPPSGLYGAPSPNTSGSEASSLNSHFVSVGLQSNQYFQGPPLRTSG